MAVRFDLDGLSVPHTSSAAPGVRASRSPILIRPAASRDEC